MPDDLLTPTIAAQVLGISFWALKKLDGQLKPIKTAWGHRRYQRSVVFNFKAEQDKKNKGQ